MIGYFEMSLFEITNVNCLKVSTAYRFNFEILSKLLV